MSDRLEIHIVSDSTGDTAARVGRAAQSQFADTEIEMIRHARVQTREGLARALESATGRRAAVFYTLVDPALREAMVEIAHASRLVVHDVLGPALNAITTASGREATLSPAAAPARRPVLPPHRGHRVRGQARRRPWRRRPAPGRHRADRRLTHVEDADLDASGLLGYMAANVPIVRGVDPPPVLFTVEPWKLVGLTIDAEQLAGIRRRRVFARRRRRPLRRPGGDLRGARVHPCAAPAAELPRDRRHRPGDRGVPRPASPSL